MARKWTKRDLMEIFEALIECNSTLTSHPAFRGKLDRNRNLFANQITREANGNIAYRSVDFDVDGIARQAVHGDAHLHRAAKFGQGFEYRYAVAQTCQVVGSGQATGSRTNDGYLLYLWFSHCESRCVTFAQIVLLGGKAFQRSDGDGLVHVTTSALVLAEVSADLTADVGQGIGLARQPVGFFVVPACDGVDVAPYVGVRWTGSLAGWKRFRGGCCSVARFAHTRRVLSISGQM